LLRSATEAVRTAAVVARAAASVRGNQERDRAGCRGRQPRNVALPAISPRPAASSQRWPSTASSASRCCWRSRRERKYAETVAALAELSGSAIDVIRPVMQSLRDDGVLIPCRVAGLEVGNRRRRARQPLRRGSMGRHELAKAKEQYGKLTVESARRLMKFWQVRAADAPPKTN
jgi:hypothetical protein